MPDITHATFTIERSYPAPPARVFEFLSDPALKSRWFAPPPSWRHDVQTMDFRVGGREASYGGPVGGPDIHYDAVFNEIVPNERVILTYEMTVDGTLISVSLATYALHADGAGTRFVFTEQGAYLDSPASPAGREHGIGEQLTVLGAAIAAG